MVNSGEKEDLLRVHEEDLLVQEVVTKKVEDGQKTHFPRIVRYNQLILNYQNKK